jgi:hypothetical protein
MVNISNKHQGVINIALMTGDAMNNKTMIAMTKKATPIETSNVVGI